MRKGQVKMYKDRTKWYNPKINDTGKWNNVTTKYDGKQGIFVHKKRIGQDI